MTKAKAQSKNNGLRKGKVLHIGDLKNPVYRDKQVEKVGKVKQKVKVKKGKKWVRKYREKIKRATETQKLQREKVEKQ